MIGKPTNEHHQQDVAQAKQSHDLFRGAPGKQTLTQRLAVQRRQADGGPAGPGGPAMIGAAPAAAPAWGSFEDPFSLHRLVQHRGGAAEAEREAVHGAAQAGVAGSGGALPFFDRIQASFGRHDVGGVRAHVGGAAASACEQIGAAAYATGTQVAFAGAPDLHTAAHEAAHVVQQRGGVQLKGGVGEAGDRHERHADEVADLVVAGQSAEAALDAYAGGGGGGAAVQHRLLVAGKPIDAGAVDAELQNAVKNGEIDKAELGELGRLQKEAGDKQDFPYESWKAAVRGVVTYDPGSLGSVALRAGSIVFTNASKKYADRAQQLIDLLDVHPSIGAYINHRPCFITLINSPTNPASVIDLGKQINIELAYWYFETYELGYTLGMLCHEFAVHPMADLDPIVSGSEPSMMGLDLDSGVKDGKKPHTVNTKLAGQVDHIFASILGMPRNGVYSKAVLEMASLLAAEAAKKGSTIAPQEVTNLLDCFMMDCASILATNDHRDKGPLVPGLIAAIYNDYLAAIPSLTKDASVLKLMPGKKSGWGVAGDYFRVTGRLAKGQMGGASRDRTSYQPTDAQTLYLEQHGRRLHWIEPDGRCVFGALGHIVGMSTGAAILHVLQMLEAGNGALSLLITSAGETVPNVIRCIREGRWADPHVGDIILEVAATALAASVTVVMPTGNTYDINGGGALIVRVTSPLEHYHATS